jgi:hypothetical protein
VATGGETSVSGSDDHGKTLSYTVGIEQVFLNGVNLVRGQDYTATNGTSVGALSALVASDVVEVFAYVPFNIANALTVSTVDAKGDLLVGTGADAVGRLAVGTNGQLLSAASGETSGLKWANPGMTLITTTTFSSVSSVSLPDNTFTSTYDDYKIIFQLTSYGTDGNITARMRASGSDSSASSYSNGIWEIKTNATNGMYGANKGQTSWTLSQGDNTSSISANIGVFDIISPKAANFTILMGNISGVTTDAAEFTYHYCQNLFQNTTSFDSLSIIFPGLTSGRYSVYGYNK